MDIYNFFIQEKERLKVEIMTAEKFLKEAPEGYIVLNNKQNSKYLFLKKNKEKMKYIKKQEYKKYLPNIKKLFYEKQLKHDKMYLKAIELFLSSFNPEIQTAEEFLQENTDIAKLLCMDTKTVTKKAAEWFEAEYISNPLYPEKRVIKTLHGEKVRSKSECIIADALFMGSFPYRYEWEIKICGVTLHPDFVIMHPATGEFYVWEHLGLADNQEYLLENIKKLEAYAKAGYIAGKNLIITTESEGHPLDSDTVNIVIRRFFGKNSQEVFR